MNSPNLNEDQTEMEPLEDNSAIIPSDVHPYTAQLLPKVDDPIIHGGANKVLPPNVVLISNTTNASDKYSAPRQNPVSGNWGIRSRIVRVLNPDEEK